MASNPIDPSASASDAAPERDIGVDPRAADVGAAAPAARVLIATHAFAGPAPDGATAGAYRRLAAALAGAGHEVAVLYTGAIEPEEATDWTSRLAGEGIRFAALGRPWDGV